jgi:hypothetical protein
MHAEHPKDLIGGRMLRSHLGLGSLNGGVSDSIQHPCRGEDVLGAMVSDG